MFKLFKRFKPVDWCLVALLVGVVVAQVYFDVTLPGYTSQIVREMTAAGATWRSILNIGGTMLLLALGSMVCTVIAGYIAAFLASKFSGKLRGDVFKKVQSFSFEETSRFSTASLITRSTNDVQQVQTAVMMILRMAISAPITAVWAIMKINASSGELTLATAAAVVILVVFIVGMFVVVLPKFKLIQKLTDKLNGVTRENLTGLRVVKAYNADGYEERKFEKTNTEISKTNLFVNRVMGLMQPVMMLVMNGISLAIYWLGATLINQGSLDYATMMAFSMLTMQVLMSFMMLTMLFVMVPRAAVSAKRINEILESDITVKDPDEGIPFVTEGEVEFKNVRFKYPGADDYVLDGISFKVERGKVAAVIGSTGSGKSTLVNLVPRFYDATEGEVLVDGVNVKDVKQEALHEKIGYVPQNSVLFSGSVRSNIAYGNADLSQDGLEKSAELAMADGFINDMDGGYDAPIAQGGKNISGGQKQRLSIARAAAFNPEIFIFDDSFSALDYKTDRAVRANLKEQTAHTTGLIVAQRIGTIMDADMIVVLEHGKMVGKGTHKELLQDCDVYREIALSQLSGEELGL
ncbi:MAG: ABC transporter ATP-binding protein/permease [Clostridiaceae bacterium]|jgi:ATP-binding cassette subfamily B protein|nr:ABC transporter ATP-binding protein/permease [Clostridiaceae bacterium]